MVWLVYGLYRPVIQAMLAVMIDLVTKISHGSKLQLTVSPFLGLG